MAGGAGAGQDGYGPRRWARRAGRAFAPARGVKPAYMAANRYPAQPTGADGRTGQGCGSPPAAAGDDMSEAHARQTNRVARCRAICGPQIDDSAPVSIPAQPAHRHR